MNNIYSNIDQFSKFIKPYKNILFICADYPGYGGAATNCDHLCAFYSKTHNVKALYWTFTKSEPIYVSKAKYHIVSKNRLESSLKSMSFKPDLIILKNAVHINLARLFKCPVIFLVPGIYKNHLNVNYTELDTIEKQNEYINQATLLQIKTSTRSFCNSSHTQTILEKWYGLKTDIFCASFVRYYEKKIPIDPKFEGRKYDYGLIVSNFDRTIKNIDGCINYLKDKKKVILIGNGSAKYKSYGFECVELVDHDKIVQYYQSIKYIVNKSFYESCSNVVIEGLFHGCRDEIVILPYKLNQKVNIEPYTHYILGNVEKLYDYDDVHSLFIPNEIHGYIVGNTDLKEIGFLIYSTTAFTLDTKSVTYACIHDKIIGSNTISYSDLYKMKLYYSYGKQKISEKILGLDKYYNAYLDESIRRYHRELFLLIRAHHKGIMNDKQYEKRILSDLNKDIFHQEKVLIISKLIQGYGGVQKTSMQLIELLEANYQVEVISNHLNNESIFNYQKNGLNNDIPNCFICKLTNTYQIEDHINSTKYKFILNNKMNEALSWRLNQKQFVICHNSMDPFNQLILKYQEKIDKLFVINAFHKNLLISHNFKPKIHLYNNHVFDNIETYNRKQTKFNYSVAFIGRITKDKNVQELIDGIHEYNEKHAQKITLYVVGCGETDKLVNLTPYIKLLGRQPFSEIEKLYDSVDYVISASVTEGKPFAIIEALSRGVPCIHSRINGIGEIITDSVNGFLFDFASKYHQVKFNMHFGDMASIFHENNKHQICNVLERAYSVSIDKWNDMSAKSHSHIDFRFHKSYCNQTNLINMKHSIRDVIVRKKLFVNFKPDKTKAYGGGNISVYYLIENICDEYSEYQVTYELEPNTDIYLIIDPFKDGRYKKYGLDEIVAYKKANGGKIVIRVNDCDKTRVVENRDRSREYKIYQNQTDIDLFIFNSCFIKKYYENRFDNFSTRHREEVIVNGCDQAIFENKTKSLKNKIRLVTHHWSNNMHKGYQLYYDLWKHTQTSKNCDIEFTFVGKNVPDMFAEVPIAGPFVTTDLSDELNKHDIYITDSVYDSCPNHVLEAISCGLPILCSNKDGGARELCTMTPYKVGELFNSFDDLLVQIRKIRENYSTYRANIQKSLHLFDVHRCAASYENAILRINYPSKKVVVQLYAKSLISVISNEDNGHVVLNDDVSIKLVRGQNIFAVNRETYRKMRTLSLDGGYTAHQFGEYKLDNDRVNILLCSDSNYFVGLFAALHSVVENTHYLDDVHFNFMIPIEQKNRFSNMLLQFEGKMGKTLEKTIIYIDPHILDPVLFQSKCYNGGGHLLSIGNLARLLIGEFMNYEKLVYLDSDSIVQYDIVEKVKRASLKYDLYACCADKVDENRQKQIVIPMSAILNECDWRKIVGHDIDMRRHAFMGAPFVTNCKKWKHVYQDMISIIKTHNETENGIYKLFTMSLQNILFYDKMGRIDDILCVIQDLGSDRKKWERDDLIYKDVLDWSGVFKPWFSNGLYKQLWSRHDIMGLSRGYGAVVKNKNQVERFQKKQAKPVKIPERSKTTRCVNYIDIGNRTGDDIRYGAEACGMLGLPVNVYVMRTNEASYNACINQFKENEGVRIERKCDVSQFVSKCNLELNNALNVIRVDSTSLAFIIQLIENEMFRMFDIYLSDGNIDKQYGDVLIANAIKMYRYNTQQIHKNSVLQKLLLDQYKPPNVNVEPVVSFTNITKNMVIKEGSIFQLEWSFTKEYASDDLVMVLQRDTHEFVSYHYLFNICSVKQGMTTFDWKVVAGRAHNKKTQFVMVCFSPRTYPKHIGWSVPFNII